MLDQATEWGASFALIAGIVLAGYVVWKFIHRQRFLRALRIARLEPHELKDQLDAGQDLTIVDLRAAFEVELTPHRIPTAHVMSFEEIEERHDEIPRGRDVVVYCT